MKKLLPIALLILLLAVGAYFYFMEPYHPERTLRGIPAEASFVSNHHKLASRWDDIMENPSIGMLLTSFGIDVEALKGQAENQDIRRAINHLFADQTVTAYMEPPASGYAATWMISTWVGGKGQALKLLAATNGGKNLESVEKYRGRALYRWQKDPDNTPLYFSLVEGTLLAAFSQDSYAIKAMLDAMDGVRNSLDGERNAQMVALKSWAHPAPDYGWWKPPQKTGLDSLKFKFDDLDAKSLAGGVASRFERLVPTSIGPEFLKAELPTLLGNAPMLLVAGHKDTLQQAALLWGQYEWMKPIHALLQKPGLGAVGLGVVGEQYSGRIQGIKIPALVGAVRVDSRSTAETTVQSVLDQINAQFRLGLVPQQIGRGGVDLFALQGTTFSPYSLVSGNDRVCYAYNEQWLIFGSNAGALQKVLNDASTLTESVPWTTVMDNGFSSYAFAWSDLDKGVATMGLALTAYNMKLHFERSDKVKAKRQKIQKMRAWLEQLKGLESLSLWMQEGSEYDTLHFTIGE